MSISLDTTRIVLENDGGNIVLQTQVNEVVLANTPEAVDQVARNSIMVSDSLPTESFKIWIKTNDGGPGRFSVWFEDGS